MLVEDLPQQPALVGDLFLAAQLIERPGAAQTLAQLSRQLSAGHRRGRPTCSAAPTRSTAS